jgi:hypothetical protein
MPEERLAEVRPRHSDPHGTGAHPCSIDFPILGMHKISGIPVAMRGLVEITMPPGGIVISTGLKAPTGSPGIVRINKMGNCQKFERAPVR